MESAHVFVSYSHEDEDARYVRQLAQALTALGVPTWFDGDLASGDRWARALRERIDRAAAVVVVMSPAAARSRWVRLEVGRARWRGRPIRPILLDGEPFPELADIQYETVGPGLAVPSARFADGLRELVAAAVPPPEPARGEVVGGWPGHNPHFVGREHLLTDLEASLYWGSSVALQGTGGVGKTQLAAEYVHRHRDDYDLVMWVDSELPVLVADQLAGLADRLGVAATPDAPATARAVLRALGPTRLSWLMVFDNAGESAAMIEWLPQAGSGHVIVTSRRTGWDAVGQRLDVDVPASGEAVTLFRRRSSAADDVLAREIVELLGRLPLAVDQAAAYIAETGTPAADYVRLLRTQAERLLDKGYGIGHEHTVATVWEVSQASLRMASPAAELLLELCSFFGPEPIPQELFSRHPYLFPSPLREVAVNELSLGAAVGALMSRSLARRVPGGLSVHRLFAAVLRRGQSAEDREGAIETVVELLRRGFANYMRADPQRWPMLRALLPHVLAVRAYLPESHTSHSAMDLGERAAEFLLGMGQAQAAIDLYEATIADQLRVLGPDHPETLLSRGRLAQAYAQAGQLGRAMPLQEAVLADALRTLGPDHPDTLAARGGLASAYRHAGRPDRAIELEEALLADALRTLGPDHGVTLTARGNLAGSCHQAGQLGRAVDLYEANLAELLRLRGADHPSTLIARDNLAFAYLEAGQIDRAIELHEAALAASTRVLGPDHPDTLTARNNLAHAHNRAGNRARAVQIYEENLADRVRVLGPDHPATLAARNNLASAYEEAGDKAKAVELFEAVLADSLRVLGPDHPDTITRRSNLAGAYLEAGCLDRAINVLGATMADQARVFGPDHPSTLTSQNALAALHADAKNLPRAIELYEAALAGRSRVLGPGHPMTLRSRAGLAWSYRAAGQLPRAISIYERLVADSESVLGTDHPDTRTWRTELAEVYKKTGQ